MNKQTSSILAAIILVFLAALSRVALYPHNFSPIIGMAVFSGAVIKDKRFAFVLPLFAMLLSDVIFQVSKIAPGFWGYGQVLNYGILALITVIAFSLKKITVLNVAAYSIMSSVIFFILSNSIFFFVDNQTYHLYVQTGIGYINCLIGGLPFFRTGLIADLTYTAVLFGAYYLVEQYATKDKKVLA